MSNIAEKILALFTRNGAEPEGEEFASRVNDLLRKLSAELKIEIGFYTGGRSLQLQGVHTPNVTSLEGGAAYEDDVFAREFWVSMSGRYDGLEQRFFWHIFRKPIKARIIECKSHVHYVGEEDYPEIGITWLYSNAPSPDTIDEIVAQFVLFDSLHDHRINYNTLLHPYIKAATPAILAAVRTKRGEKND
jgi:hypothetical protein